MTAKTDDVSLDEAALIIAGGDKDKAKLKRAKRFLQRKLASGQVTATGLNADSLEWEPIPKSFFKRAN